jgi:hypothetical protein
MKREDLASMIDISSTLVGSKTNDLRESPSQDNRNGIQGRHNKYLQQEVIAEVKILW